MIEFLNDELNSVSMLFGEVGFLEFLSGSTGRKLVSCDGIGCTTLLEHWQSLLVDCCLGGTCATIGEPLETVTDVLGSSLIATAPTAAVGLECII